MATHFP